MVYGNIYGVVSTWSWNKGEVGALLCRKTEKKEIELKLKSYASALQDEDDYFFNEINFMFSLLS